MIIYYRNGFKITILYGDVMKNIVKPLIILVLCATLAILNGSMARSSPVESIDICRPDGLFRQTEQISGDARLGQLQDSAKAWLESMMKPLGANVIGGGAIEADRRYDYDYKGEVSGKFTVDTSKYATESTTLIDLDDGSQAAEGYRGVVSGSAIIDTPGNYEVRAYLYTDSEYAQPSATTGKVQSDGSWRLSTAAVDPGFKGVWHFRLYNVDSGLETGQSWPRSSFYIFS